MNKPLRSILNILSTIVLCGAVVWTYKTWFDYEPFIALITSIIALIILNYSLVQTAISNKSKVKGNRNINIQISPNIQQNSSDKVDNVNDVQGDDNINFQKNS